MSVSRPAALLQALTLRFSVGLGRSLHLVTRSSLSRWLLVACIAPAVGLAAIGFLLNPLTLADASINKTALALTAATPVLSATLFFLNGMAPSAFPEYKPSALALTDGLEEMARDARLVATRVVSEELLR